MNSKAWRLTVAQKAELVQQYQAGVKVMAIAAYFGVSQGNVSSLIKTRGIPRRHPHRAPYA